MNEFNNKSYPCNVTDIITVNKRLRHRLRNLCAGVTMTTDRIAQLVEDLHPDLSMRCQVVKEEMLRLQVLTERMDLLYEILPVPESISLLELITELRAFFTQKFPFCNLILNGPQQDVSFKFGSYLLIALTELLQNVGECNSNSDLYMKWSIDGNNVFFSVENILNEPFFKEVNLETPAPFITNKTRHDGLGLAIVQRLVLALDGELNLKIDKKEDVETFIAKVSLTLDNS